MLQSSRVLLFSILLYFCFFTRLLLPESVSAQTLPFNDNFESGSGQWTPITGAWGIQTINGSNRYGTTVNSTSTCCSESIAGNDTWTDYSYELDLLGKQGVDKNLIFRYMSPSTKYGLHLTNSGILL